MTSSPSYGNYMSKLEMGRDFSVDDLIGFGKALEAKKGINSKVKAQFEKSLDMDDRVAQDWRYAKAAQDYIRSHPPKEVAPPKLAEVSLAILWKREEQKEQG